MTDLTTLSEHACFGGTVSFHEHYAGQSLTLRWHEGYDHGYYFISTFMEDHITHHAQALAG